MATCVEAATDKHARSELHLLSSYFGCAGRNHSPNSFPAISSWAILLAVCHNERQCARWRTKKPYNPFGWYRTTIIRRVYDPPHPHHHPSLQVDIEVQINAV